MKLHYINYMRGLAAFFIVAIHTNMFMVDGTLPSVFLASFLGEWTVVFVLISGFLFQHLLPKYEIKRYFKSKFLNVVLPYIIISIPAILIYVLNLKSSHAWVDIAELKTHSVIYQIFFFYLTGAHLGPLWFMPMLFLIYLTSPVLRILGNNTTILSYAALISIFVIYFTKRAPNDSNAFVSYAHFLPVYIIGMFLHTKRYLFENINNRKLSLYISSSLFVLFFALTVILGDEFYVYQKICLFVILSIMFLNFDGKIQGTKSALVLSLLADFSFSLYFFHGYFVGGLRGVADALNTQSALLGVIYCFGFATLFTVIIICFCWVVKAVLKNKSRMLIGS